MNAPPICFSTFILSHALAAVTFQWLTGRPLPPHAGSACAGPSAQNVTAIPLSHSSLIRFFHTIALSLSLFQRRLSWLPWADRSPLLCLFGVIATAIVHPHPLGSHLLPPSAAHQKHLWLPAWRPSTVYGSALTCTLAGTGRDQSDRQEWNQVHFVGHDMESRFHSKSNVKPFESFKMRKNMIWLHLKGHLGCYMENRLRKGRWGSGERPAGRLMQWPRLLFQKEALWKRNWKHNKEWLFVAQQTAPSKFRISSRPAAYLKRPSEVCFVQVGSWRRLKILFFSMYEVGKIQGA